MLPSGEPAGSRLPSAWCAGVTVPRTGATTIRQGTKPGSVTPGPDQLAGAGEVGRGAEGQDLDPRALPLPLGQPGERAGGWQLEDGGDAELAHRGEAGVEADGTGDLADQPGQHLGAAVDP